MADRKVAPANRSLAKAMRRAMTPAEFRLWQRLRKPGIGELRFRRQSLIGPYIVDFFCPEMKLVVEVDGDQHGFESAKKADARRTAWLRQNGYAVIRFWNRDVMSNVEDVCEAILAAASAVPGGETNPLPKPALPVSTSPQGGGSSYADQFHSRTRPKAPS